MSSPQQPTATTTTNTPQGVIPKNKAIVIGAIVVGVAAIIVSVTAAVAYGMGKKNRNGDNGCPPCPPCPACDEPRKYIFYPGVDVFSGVADVGLNKCNMPTMIGACDARDKSGVPCVGYNSSCWLSGGILPVEKWDAHKTRFADGMGSFIEEHSDPFSEYNSPDDPWRYYPGINIANSVTPVYVSSDKTISTLKTLAIDNGYIAFDKLGNCYDELPVMKVWPARTGNDLYVHRDYTPAYE